MDLEVNVIELTCQYSYFPNGEVAIYNLDYNHKVSWTTDTYSSNSFKNERKSANNAFEI